MFTMKTHSIIKIVSTILVICFTNLSCSSSYSKHDYSDDQRDYSKINSTSSRYSATVYLINGKSYDVENIVVTSDSTTWIDTNTSNKISVKTPDINRFVFKIHLAGGVGGFVIGSLSGLIIGYTKDMISEGEASFGTAIGAIVGAGAGLLIGAILGDKKEFIITPIDKK